MKIKRILVPVDFSESSLAALTVAQGIAHQFEAGLDLFHSQPISTIIGSPYAPVLPAYYFTDLARSAKNQLHTWRLEHCHDDLAIHEHVSELPATEAILDIADALDVDLIVMGTRGLTGLKHVVLGSVAERVVQRSKCPVMTVKASPTDDDSSWAAEPVRDASLVEQSLVI